MQSYRFCASLLLAFWVWQSSNVMVLGVFPTSTTRRTTVNDDQQDDKGQPSLEKHETKPSYVTIDTENIGYGIKEGLENFAINNDKINIDFVRGMRQVAFGMGAIAFGMVGAAYVGRGGGENGHHQR